jgi:ParB-like chromosome segregation protein Spo0J
MSRSKETPGDKKSSVRQAVETVLRTVQFAQLVVRTEDYSFREEEELSGQPMKDFEEEIIASRGITTPLFARDLGDGTFLVLDGHRRYFALANIIERKVKGFAEDMPIPANVVVSEAPERELIARAISANFHRRPIGALGRVKAAVSLVRHGMPKKEVARLLGVGDSTLERDILIGTTDWMMDHVRRHHITPTAASALLEQAKKHNRVEDFRDELEGWVDRTNEDLRAENRRRKGRDEDLLVGADLWPQKRLKRDQFINWVDALKTKQPFGDPEFKFRAMVKRERGTQRIEIDALSKDLDELSADHVAKIFERCADLCDALVPVLERKRAETIDPGDGPEAGGRGRERLRQLGFADVADRLDTKERAQAEAGGEDDTEFDAVAERNERDYSGTAELPGNVADATDEAQEEEADR